MTHSQKYEFPCKFKQVTFYPFMNVCHQLQLQKKLINRFRMNLKSVDFGLQNDPFIPFWADLESTEP